VDIAAGTAVGAAAAVDETADPAAAVEAATADHDAIE
jgi:hypothetical protein